MRLAALVPAPLALAALALPLAAAPAAAQSNLPLPTKPNDFKIKDEYRSSPRTTTLSLSITERIEADPDLAIVTGGVTTTAPTATEALRRNSEQMAQVVAAVRRAGINPRDVQTVGVNLNAQYDYQGRNNGEPPRFIGYQASNSVQLRVKEIAKLGAILDSLVASGANQINGPTFTLENADELQAQARLKTVAKAQASAEAYARAAGLRAARLIGIEEAGSGGGDDRLVFQSVRIAPAPPAPMRAPISPGQVRQSVTVNFTFLLER